MFNCFVVLGIALFLGLGLQAPVLLLISATTVVFAVYRTVHPSGIVYDEPQLPPLALMLAFNGVLWGADFVVTHPMLMNGYVDSIHTFLMTHVIK